MFMEPLIKFIILQLGTVTIYQIFKYKTFKYLSILISLCKGFMIIKNTKLLNREMESFKQFCNFDLNLLEIQTPLVTLIL